MSDQRSADPRFTLAQERLSKGDALSSEKRLSSAQRLFRRAKFAFNRAHSYGPLPGTMDMEWVDGWISGYKAAKRKSK